MEEAQGETELGPEEEIVWTIFFGDISKLAKLK